MIVVLPPVVLGAKYRDTVSGFVGIAIGKSEWLNGCTTVGLRPPVDKDGKLIDANWFDYPQLEFIENVLGQSHNETGGPKPTPRQPHEC